MVTLTARPKYFILGNVIALIHHHFLPLIFFALTGLIELAYVLTQQTLLLHQIILLLAFGLFFWTFTEYMFHRYAFHWEVNNKLLNPLLDALHRAHHRLPEAKRYVTSPIYLSLPIYIGIHCLFRLFTNNSSAVWTLSAGVAVGYAIYEWYHYAAHHVSPKSRVGKYLKKYHLIHHYKDSDNYYGVTSPLWDKIFGTSPHFDPKQSHRILPIDAIS